MTLGQNPFNPSRSLPTVAAISLHTLGLINRENTAGRGRSATLWAKVQNSETAARNPDTDPYGA